MAPHSSTLAGKSHGWRSLIGCSPWGRKESDTTEWLHFHFSLSCIGEGNGNPLQCSCLENPRDGGAWWAAVYGVAQSRTRLKWLSSSSPINSAIPSVLGTRAQIPGRQFYHGWKWEEGWFGDDSSTLHLLCTLFLLWLLHQLHLRSSGVRSWRLGTPVFTNLRDGYKRKVWPARILKIYVRVEGETVSPAGLPTRMVNRGKKTAYNRKEWS